MNRAFLFLCAAAFGPCLLSQSTSSGGVSGVVMDEGHAVVSGATVQLKDAATGALRGTTTNDAGRYTVQLPPGIYDLSISKIGFSVDHVNSQIVEVGLTLTIDATLKVGPEYTTIEVKAAAGSALQTMNATVGSTLSGPRCFFPEPGTGCFHAGDSPAGGDAHRLSGGRDERSKHVPAGWR